MESPPAADLRIAVEDTVAEHTVAQRTVAEGNAAGDVAADSLYSCTVEMAEVAAAAAAIEPQG